MTTHKFHLLCNVDLMIAVKKTEKSY
jgi:hypothetical protein